MATSYNRHINLYINGTQVTNDIANIRAEMNKTINTQARMTIDSKQYVAEASKIKQLKAIIDQNRADIGQIEKKWSMRNIGRLFNDNCFARWRQTNRKEIGSQNHEQSRKGIWFGQ